MSKKSEVRVRGVAEQINNDLNNIASNLGTNLSDLLKPKLREIRDSFPEELRREPKRE
jgi:gas vesicle protein